MKKHYCSKCKSKLKKTNESYLIDATPTCCIRFIKIYYCKKCDDFEEIES